MFYYPNSSAAVVLNGAIVLIENTGYHVESYNNRSIYGIVKKDTRNGSSAAETGLGNPYYYYYN